MSTSSNQDRKNEQKHNDEKNDRQGQSQSDGQRKDRPEHDKRQQTGAQDLNISSDKQKSGQGKPGKKS